MPFNIRRAFNGKNASRKRARALGMVRRIGRSTVPSGSFARAGRAIGSRAGPVGGAVGGYIGSRLAGYAGFGDYRRTYHNRYIKGSRGSRHHSHRAGSRAIDFAHAPSIRIANTEYIGLLMTSGDIQTATTNGQSVFSSQCYTNQPGLPQFPFLSVLASNFAKYRWRKLVWEYRTITSDAIGSEIATTLGQVLAAIDYDTASVASGSVSAGDEVFYANAAQMLNSEGALSVKPSDNFDMGIELAKRFQPTSVQYIRSGAIPSGTDIRLYDGSGVQFATQNVPIASGVPIAVGELFCHYDVELISPVLGGNLSSLQSAHYRGTAGGYPTATYVMGALAPTPITNNALPLQFLNSVGL